MLINTFQSITSITKPGIWFAMQIAIFIANQLITGLYMTQVFPKRNSQKTENRNFFMHWQKIYFLILWCRFLHLINNSKQSKVTTHFPDLSFNCPYGFPWDFKIQKWCRVVVWPRLKDQIEFT